MNSTLPTLYLASVSPRRKLILESLGLKFFVLSPVDDEKVATFKDVNEVTRSNSVFKARSVLSQLKESKDIAIGSDTLVVLNNEVMGKPKDTQDAIKMLRALSGNWHTVVTGLALVSSKFGERVSYTESRIKFRTLSDEDIKGYVSTREPYDKAGSYAVQGLGSIFIERMEGSYTNVMGFPLESFLTELTDYTQIPLFDWFR